MRRQGTYEVLRLQHMPIAISFYFSTEMNLDYSVPILAGYIHKGAMNASFLILVGRILNDPEGARF